MGLLPLHAVVCAFQLPGPVLQVLCQEAHDVPHLALVLRHAVALTAQFLPIGGQPAALQLCLSRAHVGRET